MKIYTEFDDEGQSLTTQEKQDINTAFDAFVTACDTAGVKCSPGEVILETNFDNQRFIGIDQKDQRKKIYDDV